MRRTLLVLFLVMATSASLGSTAGAKEFRFAFQADAANLDPDFFNEAFTQGFLNNIYEGLVGWSDEFKIVPALATDWTLESPTSWLFHLRRGVTFHDGRPFTADDVVFSFARAMGDTSNYKSTLIDVASVEKLDDFTVRIRTKARYAILPRTLASVFIMSKSWAEEHAATISSHMQSRGLNYAADHEDGTGPFRVVSRVPDVATVLESFPAWWDKPTHNITKATFQPIANAATRVAALLSGQVDMIWPVPVSDIARLKQAAGILVSVKPSQWDIMLRMNTGEDELHGAMIKGKNPFRDVRVREAVYRAVDLEAIRTRIMDGLAVLDAEPMSPTTNGYDPDLDHQPGHDPKRAKELLAAAGYPDGFDFTFDCPNDRFINDEQVCQAVAAMLARVGLKATLMVRNRVQHFTKLATGTSDMFMIGWAAAGTKDGHNSLVMMFATRTNDRGGTNYSGYSNAELDAMIDDIGQEVDPAKRQQLFSHAIKILQDQWAVIPLYVQPTIWGVRDNVEMLQLPDDNIRLWRTKIAE
ncbi:MAG: ABC transporter substrate-binding protein [Alphaproteobacteria bacterium]